MFYLWAFEALVDRQADKALELDYVRKIQAEIVSCAQPEIANHPSTTEPQQWYTSEPINSKNMDCEAARADSNGSQKSGRRGRIQSQTHEWCKVYFIGLPFFIVFLTKRTLVF